jgi:3-dehydroquinate synthase
VSGLRVPVPAEPAREYEIRIDPGGLARLGDLCATAAPAHRYAVIADSHVAELYGQRALAALADSGLDADLFTFPAGEWNKSATEWTRLCGELMIEGFGRDGVIVALGGGVTGDLAGFVASTYMRGVPVVQVPTTLLSMVDSSVGGKTGIDAGQVKNATGTFHHPAAVLVDPELLGTLAKYQRISGIAEAVKAAAIRDADFFAWIEERAPALRKGDVEATTRLIERSVRIKAEVVAEDPEEMGLRAILNFGHTFGHALESLSGFSILHGEAVAAGMRMEARLGEAMGITRGGAGDRLDEVLAGCGLPEVLEPPLDLDELLDRARPDKKSRGGVLRWILLERVGSVAPAPDGDVTHPIPPSACREPLEAALREAFEAADSSA